MDEMHVEEVDWIDANSRSGWDNEKGHLVDAKSSLRCRSVGMVFFESEDRLTLVLSRTEGRQDQLFNHSLTIPKVAVISRKKLK